jgi:16S rRNA (uracil1498-N3)-methyltransferase
MRLHRFYTTEELAPGKQISINSAELVNQVRRVFRMKPGEEFILFNGTGFDYVVKLANYNYSSKIEANNTIVVDVDPATPTRSRFVPAQKIFLYAAIVKKDTFEWIVEKATELGVTDIVPVLAERTEKKNLNEERLNKIVVEASEQSFRGDVPIIHPIVSFDGAIEGASARAGSNGRVITFHTDGEKFHSVVTQKKQGPVCVFIGPEGGWSEREVELFHTNNFKVLSLGSQILRAETAVVAALSQVVFTL